MSVQNIKLKNISLPNVPFVSFKAINLIEQETSNIKEIEEIISADQSLAAKILKIANSSFYGMRHNVNVIGEAIYILGFKTLKDVILATSVKDMYKVFGLIEKMLWEHSVGVSFAASIISPYVNKIKPDEAFLAGLLHDIGKVIINNNYPKEFVQCFRTVITENRRFHDVEEKIFGFNHTEVGYLLAEKWGFSKNLVSIIKDHHNTDKFKTDDDYLKHLFLVITLADSMCIRLGVGYKEPMPQMPIEEKEVLAMLNMEEAIYSEIINKFIDTFPEYLESFTG